MWLFTINSFQIPIPDTGFFAKWPILHTNISQMRLNLIKVFFTFNKKLLKATCTKKIHCYLQYIEAVVKNHVLGYFWTPQVFMVVTRTPYTGDHNCHILLKHNIGRDDYLTGHGRPIYVCWIIISDIPPGVQKYPKVLNRVKHKCYGSGIYAVHP